MEWAPVLDKVPRASLGSYVRFLCYVMLFIARLVTFLSPPFVLIWAGGVYGANEGGDNNGGRLGFWRSL